MPFPRPEVRKSADWWSTCRPGCYTDRLPNLQNSTPLAQGSSAAPASDAVIVVGRDGCIVEANDVAVRLFGYSRDELLRMRVEDLIPVANRAAHPANRAAYEATLHLRRMDRTSPFPAVHWDGR